MSLKNTEQLQIRIDSQTKSQAKAVFDSLGLDMSSAIKLFLKQSVNLKTLPFEIRDVNGLNLESAKILQDSIFSAKHSPKSFKKGADLIKDATK